MSTITSSSIVSRSSFRPVVWIVRFIVVMVAIVLGLAVWGASTQWMAARELSQFKEDLKSRGIPYDNVSMQAAYIARTHPEGSEITRAILKLSRWGESLPSVNALPIIGGELQTDARIVTWQEWPSDVVPEQIVSDYLAEMKPMFSLIEQLQEVPKPVRLDFEFQGWHTSLDSIVRLRNVIQILELECCYAIYKRDKDRALRAIGLSTELLDSIDVTGFFMATSIMNMVKADLQRGIQDSMCIDFWTEPEIATLRGILESHRNQPLIKRENVEWDRAAALASLESSTANTALAGELISILPRLPSAKLAIMKRYEKMIEWVDSPSSSQSRRSEEIQHAKFGFLGSIDGTSVLWNMFGLTSFSQAHIYHDQFEDSRRFALIACAIREFKLKNARWPASLKELTTSGWPSLEISTISRGTFGYEVEGELAWLWSYRSIGSDRSAPISQERPSEGESFPRRHFLSFQ